MKTLDEIFPSGRGDGRKFRRVVVDGWPNDMWFEPLVKASGVYQSKAWHGLLQSGSLASYDEDDAKEMRWVEWHPPKVKLKVMMYRPIQVSCEGHYVIDSAWMSDKNQFDLPNGAVGWEEREVSMEVGE